MAKVLIIEDNPMLQKMYRTMVTNHGYEVEVASDGLEGVEKARAVKPDMILMDVMMPKLSGLKVLEKLKADKATAGVPVVVLTNLANEADAKRAKQMGAVKYLLKTENDPAQIAVLVEQLLPKGK